MSALMVAVLAGSAAAQQIRVQPDTPASKAFTSTVALKYARKPCAGLYTYSVTVDRFSSKGLGTLYEQLVAQFEMMKFQGLGYVSGKQDNSFWAVSQSGGKVTMSYAELRGGKAHLYTCLVR